MKLSSVFCLLTTILFIVTVLTPSPAQASDEQSRTAMSPQERAMNAAKQLREYHRRVSLEAHKLKLTSPSTAPTKVGLSINDAAKIASTVFFYDNMESGTNGWSSVAYSGSDLWHQTTYDASSPTNSWWAGIEQQWNYNTGSRVNCALISPSIDLTTAVGPITLLFTENYETEAGWDFCMVDVSTNQGANWTRLRGGYGSSPSGSSGGWIISSLNLTAYAGQAVLIRFYFDTGDEKFNEFPGWFVDDVMIFDQSGLITGKKFFDVNQNHVKDSTDHGIKDWLITATGPVSLTTKTNYRGRYWLPLPLGSYTITEEEKPGWTQTYPEPFPSHWDINLITPDTLVDSIHFGNFTNASFINGMKFADLDSNGVKDPTDTALADWKVLLTDTLGNLVDFDRTDSLGQYQLFVFEPGWYIVKEVQKKGWVQSYPADEWYKIYIPDLSTTVNDKDFGNYYSPLTNSIIGQKFNDRNRNQTWDADEVGLPGFTIKLRQKGAGQNYHDYKKPVITDSSGYFQFMSLPADTYRVVEVLGPSNAGWWQSYPDSFYTLFLEDGMTHDSVNFGNYEVQPGSIGGMKFNDVNDNGQNDSEPGLSGWTIMLNGTTAYNTSVNQSMDTDPDGNFSFTGLWPGSYTVSEVMRSTWRPTYPPNLAPHFVALGPEENATGKDFGNIQDSAFSLSFRTFLPESLALAVDLKNKHKPIPPKPYKCEWSTIWIQPADFGVSDSVQKIAIRFVNKPIPGTVTMTKAGTISFVDETLLEFTFDAYLQSTDSVKISGFAQKPKPQVVKKWWFTYHDSVGTKQTSNLIEWFRLCLPMPNAINVLQAGAGTGLKVGLGGPHTVLHPSYKEVMKSLVEKLDRMHIGEPRGIWTWATAPTKPIKKQQKYLTPTKGNNKLFAEAIALQANIKASDLGITPGGFGNLIFDEGTGMDSAHPFNGKPLRIVAGMLDEYMSGYNDTTKKIVYPAWFAGHIDSLELYRVIRLIDSSFVGPIDTFSFAGGLRLKPVRELDEVSYLRLDSAAALMVNYPEWTTDVALPQQFTLEQNYPNPFNPTTTIEFYLTEPSIVTLKLYNTLGQEVGSLISSEALEDGWQEVELSADAFNLASGVYYYRIVAQTVVEADEDGEVAPSQTHTSVRKMLLLK